MKREEGIVIALDGKIAKVQKRYGDCECHGNMATFMDVCNSVDAKVGQRVIIEISEANMLKAAFIVFFLPLLSAFFGFLIGRWISQKYGYPVLLSEVSASIAAFVLAIFFIKNYDKSMSKTKTMPVITDILSQK